MTDLRTNERMEVIKPQDAGPFIRLRVDQVDEVRAALDAAGIKYWMEGRHYKLPGNQYFITLIYFGHQGNAAAIQAVLDGLR